MNHETSRLEPYVPRVASEWDSAAPGQMWRPVEGTLVFVDISGFTALSERLAQKGRVGAEELTAVLNRVFGQMLDVVYQRGGSLLKFGGDALLLLFMTSDHVMQACAATLEMRSVLRTASQERSSVGRIDLKMSSGIHTGSIDFFLVGESHRELIVAGPTASVTTEMENTADAGEIVVSGAIKDALPGDFVGDTKGSGWLLRKRKIGHPACGPEYREAVISATLSQMVPRRLREHLESGIEDSEHRIATIAFVEFQGIDSMISTQSPEAAADAINRVVAAVQRATEEEDIAFLGSDIDANGGKLIVAGGVPSGLHDDEGRVLRAARRIIDSDCDLDMKIGVNRGHVYSGNVGTEFRRTFTVMGDTVNLAARLMAAAEPGQIYATPSVLNLSSTLFETEPLEPFHVKGKEQPVQAFAVYEETGARPPELATELPFKGREPELEMLVGIVNTCSRTGRGGIMTITGDTGVGKSRLITEILERCSGIDTVLLQAEPSGIDNPYWAFRDPLRRRFGIDRGSREEMTKALESAVVNTDADLEWAIPLLGDVLHIEVEDNDTTGAIDPRFRPDRTADALIELLSSHHRRPVALVAEDGQWLDEASLALLSRVGKAAEERPWTALVTARSDSDFESMGEEISLRPLDDEDIRSIAIEATKATPLRPHELDTVVARADGNPLFLGEVLRVISETGTAEELPESLDAVVSTEIDTLPPLPRQLLRYVSVLGRRFRRVVVNEFLEFEAVAFDDATVHELQRFLDDEGDGRLAFRHNVVHDIAYGGLSYSKRRELHARAGDVIERGAGDDPDAVAEYLSTHYSLSGEHQKAWHYARVAAEKARSAYANAEAAAQYRRAIEAARHLGSMDSEEITALWIGLGEVNQLSGQIEATRAALSEAARLVENDPLKRADIYLRRVSVWMDAGNFTQAKKNITLGRRGLERDGELEHVRKSALLDSYEASVHAATGDMAGAVKAAEAAIEKAKLVDEKESMARAYMVLDRANFMMGVNAPRHGEQAIAIFEDLGMGERSVGVMNNLGIMSYLEGDWDIAVDWYRRSVEAAERLGDVLLAALTRANIAEVLIGQRKFEEATDLLENAERTFRASNAPTVLPFVRMLKAQTLLGLGQTEAAVAELESLGQQQMNGHTTDWTGETVVSLGRSLVDAGRSADALSWMDRLEAELPDEAARLAPAVSCIRALAESDRGDQTLAAHHIQHGLRAAEEHGAPFQEALLLEASEQINTRAGTDSDLATHRRLTELFEKFGVLVSTPA